MAITDEDLRQLTVGAFFTEGRLLDLGYGREETRRVLTIIRKISGRHGGSQSWTMEEFLKKYPSKEQIRALISNVGPQTADILTRVIKAAELPFIEN